MASATSNSPEWPLRCICNLCDCGDHRCSTFGLPGGEHEQTGVGQFEDSKQRQQQMAANEGQQQEGGHFHQCNYNCGQTNHRFLMNKSPGFELASTDNKLNENVDSNANNRSPANDTLHVLVSRPQIATRPRDNIIFEGDMDLRTTFETSYEALARTRLDTWRRHQELQARRVAGSGPANGRRAEAPEEEAEEEERGRGEPRPGEQLDVSVEDEQQQGQQRAAKQTDKRLEGRSGGSSDVRSFVVGAGGGGGGRAASGASPARSKVSSPLPATSPVAPARPLRAKPIQQSRHDLRREQPKQRQQRRHQQPETRRDLEKQTTDNFVDAQLIDPDLSPIIVYDANMNRLEKVGVRKRSKYRPSTSLRSGARGLFGDQAEGAAATGTAPPKRDEAVQVGGPGERLEGADEAGRPRDEKAAAGLSSRGALYAGRGSPGGQGVVSPELVALEARQALGLTYTDRNLPVDTKRKNLDNINLVDHLQEQSRDLQAAGQSPTQNVGVAGAPMNGLHGEQQQHDRLLSAREEEAALDEIRRCTLKSPSPSNHLRQSADRNLIEAKRATSTTRLAKRSTPVETKGRASSTSTGEVGDNSKQDNRLQRTCQNQSFYLNENEYPEPKHETSYHKLTPIDGELELGGDGRAYGLTGTPVESQRRRLMVAKRTNLFRESPDSTLNFGERTTNKDNEQRQTRRETKEEQKPSRERRSTGGVSTITDHDDEDEGDAAAQGDNFDHYNRRQLLSKRTLGTPTGQLVFNGERVTGSAGELQQQQQRHTCKVLLLDRDYDFVGDHSGHHYFVEKQLNANEIYEREAPL